MTYLFEREREREREKMRGRRSRGRKSSSRLPTEQVARGGARALDPEIMTCAETKSWELNQLSHPGALVMDQKVLVSDLYFDS